MSKTDRGAVVELGRIGPGTRPTRQTYPLPGTEWPHSHGAPSQARAIEEERPTVREGHNASAAPEMIVAVCASHLAGRRVSLPPADRIPPLASEPQVVPA
jgi:hypothetical protein